MNWHASPNGYYFKHITVDDFDHVYYVLGRGSPGSLYKVTYTMDKTTGTRVPSYSFVKGEKDMSHKELKNIKHNWIKADTLRYEDIDPYTFFKHLLVVVKDKIKMPRRLQNAVFVTYLDPKLSNMVKPKTKQVMGDILNRL